MVAPLESSITNGETLTTPLMVAVIVAVSPSKAVALLKDMTLPVWVTTVSLSTNPPSAVTET